MYDTFDNELQNLVKSDNSEFNKKWNELSEEIDKYVNHAKEQLNREKKDYKGIQLWHTSFQLIIIVGTIIIPILVNIQEIPRIAITILSALIAVIASISNYFKFEAHRSIRLQTIVKLIQELNWHATKTGPYKNLLPGAALDLFLERTISIDNDKMHKALALEIESKDQKRDEAIQTYKAQQDLVHSHTLYQSGATKPNEQTSSSTH